ncbi:MAG: hypothetical protein B6244_01880 [Candidatus Cloacimonetes bacterium 4572_55]|nr:MAG: hypothetical protein B6244_01880 [Candidatus Cloacimonetes bacterium 4572_55]
MGIKIEKGGKFFIVLIALALISYGLWKYGVLDQVMNLVAPSKKPAGEVTQDDFFSPNSSPSTPDDPDLSEAAPVANLPEGSEEGLKRPIRVAIVTWGGYAGGIMANNGFAPNKDCLFYRDYGIQVELLVIDDFVQSREAFKAGGNADGVDIMWSTVDAYALEYPSLSNLKPVAIMQYDWSRGGDAIAVAQGIESVIDLKGKQIAVAEATPSHYFALYVLTQGGLTNRDVQWVFTNSAVDAANTFKAGHVDACVSWSPDVYMAAKERPGAKILTSTREATHLIADIFVARGDFVRDYPQEAAAFVTGWLKGVDMVEKNSQQACRLMADNFAGIGLEDAEGMLDDVKLPDYWENREFFEMDVDIPVGFEDVFKSASGLWRKIGLTSKIAQAYQAKDTRFLSVIESRFPKKVVEKQEFDFKKSPDPKKTSILTKRVSIYFAIGSDQLDENAKYGLEQIAELASTFGSAYMRVAGNTDNTGSYQKNVQLSKRRAQAVSNYLVEQYGFDSKKFAVVGNGPDKPIADNNTEQGRAKNRRTDFEVIPK